MIVAIFNLHAGLQILQHSGDKTHSSLSRFLLEPPFRSYREITKNMENILLVNLLCLLQHVSVETEEISVTTFPARVLAYLQQTPNARVTSQRICGN